MRNLVVGAILACLIAAPPARSDDSPVVTHTFQGSFDDATFAVENAIINHGLVIDSVSHVGEMLARTKDDVGGGKDLFENADLYQFCSALISRKVMEADIRNIAYCPYRIFVFSKDGVVTIGYPGMPEGPMKEVEALLDSIVREAAE
jgi:uncharacterized protein (DUF302 family)